MKPADSHSESAFSLLDWANVSLFLPLFPRPPFFHHLSRSPDCERVLWHILRDTRCGSNIGAFSDTNRRDERAVTAHEYAILNDSLVFVHPVVIAGNRTRSDVHSGANLRVAKIGQVICL